MKLLELREMYLASGAYSSLRRQTPISFLHHSAHQLLRYHDMDRKPYQYDTAQPENDMQVKSWSRAHKGSPDLDSVRLPFVPADGVHPPSD